jgi:hypothetical protein
MNPMGIRQKCIDLSFTLRTELLLYRKPWRFPNRYCRSLAKDRRSDLHEHKIRRCSQVCLRYLAGYHQHRKTEKSHGNAPGSLH